MRKIKYKDLSPDLKVLVKRMEDDLNIQHNREKSSESRLQILTDHTDQSDSISEDEETTEYDVAVFQVETATGEYIFSHIERKDGDDE